MEKLNLVLSVCTAAPFWERGGAAKRTLFGTKFTARRCSELGRGAQATLSAYQPRGRGFKREREGVAYERPPSPFSFSPSRRGGEVALRISEAIQNQKSRLAAAFL